MGKMNNVWVRYFRDKKRFADLFNGVCFQGRQVLQAEHLTAVSEVYEGVEVNNYANWSEKICRMKKTDRLITTYTLCLYHGEEKWDGPRTLKDMMDFGDDEDGMSEFFVDYAFLLYCVNGETDLKIFHTEISQLFELLWYRRNKAGLRKLLKENSEYLQMDSDTLEVAAVALNAPYIWEERNLYMSNEEKGEYNMCQALKEWLEEERTVGIEDGEKKKLVEQICKKLRKGKRIQVIAEELEEEVSVIQGICDSIEKYAPDYDFNLVWESIYEREAPI